MLKIGFVNLLLLLSYNFFFGGAVNISQSFPKSVKAGEDFIVEITIDKGDHKGFAKWQQELPKGFVAEALETKDATFSFKDGEVKLIWMSIPSDERFTISYKVSTKENIKGAFKLTGQFSYLEENERKTIDAKTESIIIKSSKTTLSASSTNAQDTTKGQVEVSEEVTASDDITINRRITHLGKGVYQVDLNITKKEGLNRFGKIEEYLPAGFTASEIESENGIFSLNNGVVKILWMTLPDKTNYTVSYQITSNTDELNKVTLHGVFSYLDEDVSKQEPMVGSRFTNYYFDEEAEEAILAEEAEQEEEFFEAEAEEEETEFEKTSPIATETAPKESVKRSNQLIYKVQIASSKVKLDIEKFKSRKKLDASVWNYRHKDWYMYTIGSFDSYHAAKQKRNNLWHSGKITDAFIVAFKGQKRISIQEALLISNEKWSK